MSVLQWAVILSAGLAVTGVWPRSRIARCSTFWPVPLMVLATAVGVVDLAGLVKGRSYGLSTTSLVLGVWAALVADLVGWIEIRVGRRGRSDGHALLAPAVLLTVGLAMFTTALGNWPDVQMESLLPSLSVLAAGALLTTARSLQSAPSALRLGWPIALLLSALVVQPPPADPLAEARQELAEVLESLRREGAQVTPMDAAGLSRRTLVTPVEVFRVDGVEVRAYLIAHDLDSELEAHLSPRLSAPPPSDGVSHLHAGSHILVVCLTTDAQFARRLEVLVHRRPPVLGAQHRRLS